MKSGDLFALYKEYERNVVDLVENMPEICSDIVRIVDVPRGKLYDNIIVFADGTQIKVEIQIRSPSGWQIFKNLNMDVISNFSHKPGSIFVGMNKIIPESVEHFYRSINVRGWGKLYKTEADILIVYVPEPYRKMWILRTDLLSAFRDSWIKKYGLIINKKTKRIRDAGDFWQSAFMALPPDDDLLLKAGVYMDAPELEPQGELPLFKPEPKPGIFTRLLQDGCIIQGGKLI